MVSFDSIFTAVAPLPPSVVFIGYDPLLEPTIPAGANVHVFSVNGGDVVIN